MSSANIVITKSNFRLGNYTNKNGMTISALRKGVKQQIIIPKKISQTRGLANQDIPYFIIPPKSNIIMVGKVNEKAYRKLLFGIIIAAGESVIH